MNDLPVAQHAGPGVAGDLSIEDVKPGHHIAARQFECFANLCVAIGDILEHRSKHALHGRFHFIEKVVDDGVETNVDIRRVGGAFGRDVRPNVEPDDDAPGGGGQTNVGFRDRSGTRIRNADTDFVAIVIELEQRGLNSFERALHVGLEHHAQFRCASRSDLVVEIGQLDAALHDEGFGPPLGLTLLDDLTRGALVVEDLHRVASAGEIHESQDLDREARICTPNALAAVVEHRFHAAPGGARHHDIADVQCAALDKQRCHRSAIAVDLRFDHDPAGQLVRIRLELVHVGDEQDDFEQIVESQVLACRHFDEWHVATPVFRNDIQFRQLLLDKVRICRRQVDLVDGNDHRHVCRPNVRHSLSRGRHDAVVRGYDQHGHIGGLGAASAHGGEGLVAGRIEEGDLSSLRLDLVGANMLGDAAGLAFSHIGRPDRVQQLGLAMVDVPHDRNDRRPGNGIWIGLTLRAARLEVGIRGLDRLRYVLVGLPIQVRRDAGSSIEVDLLVDVGHHLELHQFLDDLDRSGLQIVGQFGHRHDGRQRDWFAYDRRTATQSDGSRASTTLILAASTTAASTAGSCLRSFFVVDNHLGGLSFLIFVRGGSVHEDRCRERAERVFRLRSELCLEGVIEDARSCRALPA